MKRFLTIMLCAAMILTTFALPVLAEESPTLDDVRNMLDALNDDATAEQIAAVRAAYESLSPDDQAQIATSDATSNVINTIYSLDPSIKPEKYAALKNAYEALSSRDKALVYNYDALIDFEKSEYVPAINTQIADFGDPMCIDVYSFESLVNNAYDKYNILTDEAKAQIVNADALFAAKAKIDRLRAFNDNKSVELVNSALRGLAKYDKESLNEALNTPALGIYYYFEEVDLLERSDWTNGYYDINPLNNYVESMKYCKLELDIKVTDVDIINGWPAPFRLTVGGFLSSEGECWSGYDFVNGVYFQGASSQNHSRIFRFDDYTEKELEFGVWHHMVIVYDHENVTYTVDGVEVLNAQIDPDYEYLILYPWLSNLEMTNVVFTDGAGKVTRSPFRDAVNSKGTPGWERRGNEEGATLLTLIEEALDETRYAYNALSAAEKEQIVGAENIDRVQAIIDELLSHTVTVTDGTADIGSARADKEITITANAAPEGKVFDMWQVVEGEVKFDDEYSATTTFTMPDGAVSVKATFKDKTGGEYDVIVENGTANVAKAAAGVEITVTADKAPEGMRFDHWEFVYGGEFKNEEDKTGKKASFTFYQTEGGCSLKAVFVEGEEVVPGDFTGDGKVNAKDVTGLMKAIIKGEADGNAAADFNLDGKVNAKDVIAIMKSIIKGGK